MHLCARGTGGFPRGVQVDRAGVLKPEPEPAEAKPGNGKAKDKDKPAELKRKYMGGGIATEY